VEIVALCADAVQQLGFSRSVGQIFGVIYGSPSPLTFADVVDLLEISNGSASQGLRFLRDLGAIRSVEIDGDRREHFIAETELRRLLGGLLRARLRAPLEAGASRLKALRRAVEEEASEGDAAFLRQRVESLAAWHRKALLFLPFIESAVGTPKD
jgi:DNA-binding transcriptional regulator GbsR (MarR family)